MHTPLCLSVGSFTMRRRVEFNAMMNGDGGELRWWCCPHRAMPILDNAVCCRRLCVCGRVWLFVSDARAPSATVHFQMISSLDDPMSDMCMCVEWAKVYEAARCVPTGRSPRVSVLVLVVIFFCYTVLFEFVLCLLRWFVFFNIRIGSHSLEVLDVPSSWNSRRHQRGLSIAQTTHSTYFGVHHFRRGLIMFEPFIGFQHDSLTPLSLFIRIVGTRNT